jgi:hypothetical protein
MLAFTSAYFFESDLYNELRPIQIKKFPARLHSPLRLCEGTPQTPVPFVRSLPRLAAIRPPRRSLSDNPDEITRFSGSRKEIDAKSLRTAGLSGRRTGPGRRGREHCSARMALIWAFSVLDAPGSGGRDMPCPGSGRQIQAVLTGFYAILRGLKEAPWRESGNWPRF